MATLSSLTAAALGRGISALLPLVRTRSNDALLSAVSALPGLSLGPGHGRDSAHFFLNFLRYADGRGMSREAIADRAERYLVRPVLASERNRLATRARHGIAGLRSLILSPTVACNLRCEHCYNLYEIHHDGRDRLSLETMRRVVSEARELGAFRVSVIGGEPLLRWRDLDALAESHNDVLFTVFTNGLLVTDEVAGALAGRGNVELAVSIDGPRAMHDAWRGEGTYDKATAALARYARHGGMALFAPTVTSENYQALLSDAFVDEMLSLGAYMGYLHHYDLLGGQDREDWLLDRGQLRWMQARIERIHREKPVSVLSNVVSDLLTGGCPAVRDFVHVNHKGEVEPCCMVPFAAESVQEKSLVDVLRSRFMGELRDAPADGEGVKRCLVGENLVTLRRAVERGGARGTTKTSERVFGPHGDGVREKLPTCFSMQSPS